MTKTTEFAAALLIVVPIAVGLSASNAEAKSCKSKYVSVPATVPMPNNSAGKADAINRWVLKATLTYGPAWSDWSLASSKGVKCTRKPHHSLCRAYAKPCTN